MISKPVWQSLVTIAAIVGAVWAIEVRYQLAVAADEQHQYLAAEDEVGRLETDLKLIDLELKQIRAIKERRELTDEESDRETYLKQRRQIITERLTEVTKAA
jgi:hypothetical protein